MKNNKQRLLEYLRFQNLMSLATCGKRMWISTVYYVVDEQLNLYFLSEPMTIHCQDIKENSQVACAIADSKQKVTDKKIGVQARGIASEVNSLEKIKWVLAMWNKHNPGIENIINLKNIQRKVINSKIYKIKPSVIKFFNEELYGPEGFEIFKF